MVKSKRKKILAILFLLLFFGCANQLPPGGGKEDVTPPKIIEVFPVNQTINYDGDYFELTFDEYVDKRSFKDAIFISPAVEGTLEISWTNRTVTVYFPEKLKLNRTYTINIGTDVTDYNNRNRMAENYSFAFSTGGQIDNGIIKGNVYSESPSGTMVFAYLLDESSDTLDITARKPDYISQAGEKGSYTFSGLTLGNYKIFAIKDEFRNFIYDLEQDAIGVPFTEVNLNSKDTIFSGMDFRLTVIDTVPPRLLSAVMTDRNHILINFSEEIKTELLTTKNFLIVDSTSENSFLPEFAFKGRTKEKEFVLSTNASFNVENDYFILVNDISDIGGICNKTDYIKLTISDKADTSAPILYRTLPAYNARKVDYQKTSIKFYFDDAFAIEELRSSVQFIDTLGNEFSVEVKKIDDAAFEVLPKAKLKPSTTYLLKFDLNRVKDLSNNFLDSIYTFKFTTKSELDYTSISGKVINVDLAMSPIVVLESVDDTKMVYQQPLDVNGKYAFSKIDPGKYKIFCYLDKNKNNSHDLGYPQPFGYAEEFHYHKETIDVPPRWEVTDVIFNFVTGD